MNEQLSFFAADPRDVEAIDMLAGVVAQLVIENRGLAARMRVLELAIARLSNDAAPSAAPARLVVYLDEIGTARRLRVAS